MWLTILAMRRPVTIMVALAAVALCAVLAIDRMRIDIFPELGQPAIYIAQPYGGMEPSQMEGYLVSFYEYHFLYITGIEHVESKFIQGASLIKLVFHPGTDMSQALAETVSYVDRSRAFMPPGTLPPFVVRLDAGSVPVGYLVFRSNTRSPTEIQDLALFRVRPLFSTLPGVSAPPPFGGNARTVVVHVDPDRLRAYQMSPEEVVQAINRSNAVMPAGNVRVGNLTTITSIDAVVGQIQELMDLPIRIGSGPSVYLRDVGRVENSSDILTGYALVNGQRAIYIPVNKRADASTLAVINRVKAALPTFQAVVPEDLSISLEFEQSGYVTHAVKMLSMEIALGSVLTGLMVLVFLRSWRSALIVLLTIPFALLASVTALWALGQTINIMSLGGLALAVGVLVDESTVAIENIHTHLRAGAETARAVLNSANETSIPRFVSMLSVLAVFIPSLFMVGIGKALFVPLALAVAFAMAASYLLASTFVPIMATWLLAHSSESPESGLFDRLHERYSRLLEHILRYRKMMVTGYVITVSVMIAILIGLPGTEMFPSVDLGQFQVRVRAPDGTRIERTELIAKDVLKTIEDEVGRENVSVTLGYVGTVPPSYPVNLLYLWTSGPHEALLRIALKPEATIPVATLKEKLRKTFAERFSGVSFSFEAGDIVSQVVSMGSPTPLEVSVTSPKMDANVAMARKLMAKLNEQPTLRDLQFVQPLEYPTIQVKVDRIRAGQLGVVTSDVARSLVAATSSSRFVQPIYWRDPSSGVAYQLQVEVPQADMASLEDLRNVPVMPRSGDGNTWIYLNDVSQISRGTTLGEYDRYNMQRMITLTANIEGEDLGRAGRRVADTIAALGELPKGMTIKLRGQVAPMLETLDGLRTGLLLTIIVVLLLLTANFQSLRHALVVLATLPGALVGVLLALLITKTTVNVQSFLGAIMAMGVAAANAILLVTFAHTKWMGGASAPEAAREGAAGRLRPILMTSGAMIMGMIPLALGLETGGEQTSPLGRAVIGGLLASMGVTLFIVPCVFAWIHGSATPRSSSLHPDDPTPHGSLNSHHGNDE